MENPNNLGAVDWLEKEVYKAIENTSENSIDYVLEKLFQQAKEIFKQQIIDAGNTCALKQVIHIRKVELMSLEELEQYYASEEAINVGEEYYNEKFKNK